ncbi:MAG TPA: hypothetical protein VMN77_01670 [Nitrospiria bacterium]|jgi:hypothetical protein|nr:hypothetical protein [Nitrospiria bacterium]
MPYKYRVVIVVLIGGLLWISGCEHAPVKPTEDSKRLQQIDAFVENLRVTYESRNGQAFSTQYLDTRPDDLRAIVSFLVAVNSLRLNFMIDQIVLQDDKVQVALHWENRWKSEKTDWVKQRGDALFHLAGKSDLHLQSIDGENPFTAPINSPVSPP